MLLKLYIFTVSGRKSHPRGSQLSPSKARCRPENKKTMTQCFHHPLSPVSPPRDKSQPDQWGRTRCSHPTRGQTCTSPRPPPGTGSCPPWPPPSDSRRGSARRTQSPRCPGWHPRPLDTRHSLPGARARQEEGRTSRPATTRKTCQHLEYWNITKSLNQI